MLENVTKTTVPEGVMLTAKTSRWACAGSFLAAVVFLAFAGFVYNAAMNGPNQTGALYFMWVLLLIAFVLMLLGVQRFRNRVSVLIKDDGVVVQQVGLFAKRRVWNRKENENYYLIVAHRNVAPLSEQMSHRRNRPASTVKVADLELSDTNGNRHCLVKSFEGWNEICELALEVAKALSLPLPEFVDLDRSTDEETAHQEAHVRHLEKDADEALGEMKDAVAQMEDALDKIHAAGADLDPDDVGLQPGELQEMEDAVNDAKEQILQAHADVSLSQFGAYEFLDFRPGESVRYRRIVLSPRESLASILSLPGTTGAAILILMTTPIAVPLLGTLVVTLLGLFPLDVTRVQIHLAVADLCSLDLKVFLWAPFFIALYILWVWLKVDASFAPFEVHFDWSIRELTIEKCGESQRIGFDAVEALSLAVVLQSKGRTPMRNKYGVMLFAELSDSNVPVLELEFETESPDELSVRIERFDTLASMLAHSLEVRFLRKETQNETYDVVGFPFSHHALHAGRIYRLASKPVRQSLLGGLAAAGLLLVVLFSYRFVANRLEAENYMATRAKSPPARAAE